MLRLTACAASATVLLATTAAGAQTVKPPANEMSLPVVEDPNAYPQAEAERPLLYPAGVEVEGYFETFDDDASDYGDYLPITIIGRWGDGKLEAFGAMRALARQPSDTDVETLRFIRGGAALSVGEELALRADLKITDPTADDITIYNLRGTGEFKRVLTPVFAVVGIGGLELFNPHPDPAPPDTIYDLLVFLRSEGIYQANHEISLRARGTLWFPIASGPEERDPTTRLDLAFRGMYSPGSKFDVYGELVIERATNDEDDAGLDPTATVVRIGALVRL